MKSEDYTCDQCGKGQKKRISREEAKKIIETIYEDPEEHEEEIIKAIGVILEAQDEK